MNSYINDVTSWTRIQYLAPILCHDALDRETQGKDFYNCMVGAFLIIAGLGLIGNGLADPRQHKNPKPLSFQGSFSISWSDMRNFASRQISTCSIWPLLTSFCYLSAPSYPWCTCSEGGIMGKVFTSRLESTARKNVYLTSNSNAISKPLCGYIRGAYRRVLLESSPRNACGQARIWSEITMR